MKLLIYIYFFVIDSIWISFAGIFDYCTEQETCWLHLWVNIKSERYAVIKVTTWSNSASFFLFLPPLPPPPSYLLLHIKLLNKNKLVIRRVADWRSEENPQGPHRCTRVLIWWTGWLAGTSLSLMHMFFRRI